MQRLERRSTAREMMGNYKTPQLQLSYREEIIKRILLETVETVNLKHFYWVRHGIMGIGVIGRLD